MKPACRIYTTRSWYSESLILDHDTFGRLCRSRDALAASYRERITLEQAAQYAHLSPYHFHRLFARAFGQTPHEFLTQLRINEAKRLLAQDHHSVTEICFDLGYSSLGTFSSRFHSLAGRSPTEYRREAQRVYGSAALWRLQFVPGCLVHLFTMSLGLQPTVALKKG